METKSLVNIPKTVVDPYYRYKRHRVQIETVKHNGGQTKLLNLSQLASELNRENQQLVFWFQREIKTRIILEHAKTKTKSSQTDLLIFQSTFTQDELDKVLEKYILNHVLCQHCKNPETISVFSKSKTLTENFKNVYYRKCKACGKRSGVKH